MTLLSTVARILQLRCDWRFGRPAPWAWARKLRASRVVRMVLRTAFAALHPIPAINIGDRNTSFWRWGWLTLDLDQPSDVMCNIKREQLPFLDGSVGYLYASHVLEHLKDDEIRFFLRECHRVLRPSGLLRLVVPDLDLFVSSFTGHDSELHFERPVNEFGESLRFGVEHFVQQGIASPGATLSHNGLIAVVASYTNGTPPIDVSREEFDRHFDPNDLDGFVRWCVSLKVDGASEDFGHFNGFNYRRLRRFLVDAGFPRICRGFYNDPFVPARMRGMDLANKQHISLYVNAGK